MKKINVVITVFSILTATCLIALGIIWGVQAGQVNSLKTQLENVYQNNFYELTDNVNNIESNLSKLTVSTEKQLQEDCLSDVITQCNNAQANLSALPLKQDVLDDATNFVNQLGGYTYILRQQLINGEELTLDDIDQLVAMNEVCLQIKYELNRLALKIAQGYSIVDNSTSNLENSTFNNEWGGLGGEIIKYPQLIYDGPFSDSVQNREVKGLPSELITETEAKLLVEKWFNTYNVNSNGESAGGNFETWNFSVEKNGVNGYVQVTKQGGLLLQFALDDNPSSDSKTIRECEVLAEEFAKQVNFEDTRCVWSTQSGNYVLCNLVYVQDDVDIYPDMIKVKVNKDTGEIVGWEARSWAFNHQIRTDLKPEISLEKAKEKVDSSLDIMTSKLCVVPQDYVGEKLAYEFKCVSGEAVYYIYVDALTGSQFRILKIVQTDDGNLLI